MNVARLEARQALIDYVRMNLGLQPKYRSAFSLEPYLALLPTGNSTQLHYILTTLGTTAVEVPWGRLDSAQQYVNRQTLTTHPASLLELENVDPDSKFEHWYSIIRRAASTTLGSKGETGVSLFHEFRLLSALVHASNCDPAQLRNGFVLVNGDFPGVQKTIYTITSDGATKGVRGRSFFLQLLADCTVRALLQRCGNVPISNALTVAGGNFTLLVPKGYAEAIDAYATDVNDQLLDLFYGDVTLVVTTTEVDPETITTPAAFKHSYEEVRPAQSRAKTRPLAAVSRTKGWSRVFETYGEGAIETCIVCQREPMNDIEKRTIVDLRATNTTADANQEKWICPQCEMFRELAEDLSKYPSGLLVFKPITGIVENTTQSIPTSFRRSYAERLSRITGWSCELYPPRSQDNSGESAVVLQLGRMEFSSTLDGFRLFAVHTPRTTVDDVARFQTTIPDMEEGAIAPFDVLARRNSQAFPRLGYLRMDVDSLGKLFAERLQPLTITRRMAASDALSLFFDGYLPELCREVEEEQQRPNSLYLLYGGGDDLFIVGEWEMLPHLAWRIRERFGYYTNDAVTISAGITLFPPSFPFYRAADLSGEALEQAKGPTTEKDAITFLNERFAWKSDWPTLVQHYQNLIELSDEIGTEALIRNILSIYKQWEASKKLAEKQLSQEQGKVVALADKDFFGPYMWLSAYQITRLAAPYTKTKPILYEKISQLQETLLSPLAIRLSGAAARWAEMTRRANTGDTGGEQT